MLTNQSTKTDTLKAELKNIRDGLEESHAVRLHRALSWMKCAEEQAENPDLQFISLWIAFNACYGVNGVDVTPEEKNERKSFKQFIQQLVELDSDRHFYNCLWKNYSGFVRSLIENRFVFSPFWGSHYAGNHDWEDSYERSKKAAFNALANERVSVLLEIVLDRLYVLRNQLMHGGATYQSQVNRSQVKDGCRMMTELLPVIITIMMQHADKGWGQIYYPVIKD